MKQELVKDWMTPDPLVVSSESTLPEVHRLLTENRIRRLPVVDDGLLVGMVTLGDVREAEPSSATSLSIWEVNYLLAKLTVDQIMTPGPITVSETTTIEGAANLMLRDKIGGLPVVDAEDKVVGIITESDIFRMVVATWRKSSDKEVEANA
jgi:acetoin utilization protein AcuB